jgi:hypothetical protein
MDPSPPPAAVIVDDRPCLSCGYNLKGLDAAARCPECAAPVANSLQGNLLRYSKPQYLAILHRGVLLIQAAIIIQFLTFFILVPAVSFLGLARAGRFSSVVIASAPSFQTAVLTATGVVSIIGWWMFSWPDPAIGERDEGTTARRVVRATIIIQAAATMASMAGRLNFMQGASDVVEILVAMLNIAAIIAWLVWFFAAMSYIKRVAPRIPSERIYRRARLLTWLCPLLVLVVCIGWLIDPILYYNLLNSIRRELKAIRAATA